MKNGRIAGVIAGCLCLAAAAHGETSSYLRPGLWNVTLSGTSNPDYVYTFRMCIDQASERRLVTHTSERPPEGCSKYERRFTSTGAVIDTVCSLLGGTSTTHRVVTYTGDVSYTMTMHAQRTQPNKPLYEDTISEKGAWQSPCPSSMKPGDMTQMTLAPK
jgi:hypothetical protein